MWAWTVTGALLVAAPSVDSASSAEATEVEPLRLEFFRYREPLRVLVEPPGTGSPMSAHAPWTPFRMLAEGRWGTLSLMNTVRKGAPLCAGSTRCPDLAEGGVAMAWNLRRWPVAIFAGLLLSSLADDSGRRLATRTGFTLIVGLTRSLPNLADLVQR